MIVAVEEVEVLLGGYDLKVKQIKGSIVVIKMKTTLQRKFRGVKEFYNEVNNINANVNKIDKMLIAFSGTVRTDEEIIEESDKVLMGLGIEKEDVIKLYKDAVVKELENIIEKVKATDYK